VNVYGMRLVLVPSEDGIPMDPSKIQEAGKIRFYKRNDNSRRGREDENELKFSVPWENIPTSRHQAHVPIQPTLTFDPRRDTWCAPEFVKTILLTVHIEPEEKLYAIQPRPENYQP